MVTNNVDTSSSLNLFYCNGSTKETKQSDFDKALNNLLLDSSECTDFISKQKEELYQKLKDGETEESIPIGGNSFTATGWNKLMDKVDTSIETVRKEVEEEIQKAKEAAEEEAQQTDSKKTKCPYSELERDGMITYNGISFMCDKEHNAITLGDMSDKSKIISIRLEGGGKLLVNRDNLKGLAKAIGMFSPADVKRIMVEISKDNQCEKNQKDIEDEENDVLEE